MKRLDPNKLLHIKWTARQPHDGEKHFTVVQVGGKKSQRQRQVTVQAATTGQTYTLDWRDLTDAQHWHQGWQLIEAESPSFKGSDAASIQRVNHIEPHLQSR